MPRDRLSCRPLSTIGVDARALLEFIDENKSDADAVVGISLGSQEDGAPEYPDCENYLSEFHDESHSSLTQVQRTSLAADVLNTLVASEPSVDTIELKLPYLVAMANDAKDPCSIKAAEFMKAHGAYLRVQLAGSERYYGALSRRDLCAASASIK